MAKILSTSELYDTKTLFTLSGASMAVWIFTAVLANILKIEVQNIKWVGLLVALFLAYAGAFNLNQKFNINLIIVAFFNGLLIYITASGIDSINHSADLHVKPKKEKIASIIPLTDKAIWWEPKELKDSIKFLNDIILIKDSEIIKLNKELKIIRESCEGNNVIKDSTFSEKLDVKLQSINQEVVNSKNNNSIINTRIDNKTKKPHAGYLVFSVNEKYGLIYNNDTLINPSYDKLELYKYDSTQYFIVSKNGQWGVLSENMKLNIAIKQKTKENAITALKMVEYLKVNKKNMKIGID